MEQGKSEILPEDLARGREFFLARIREKIEKGGRIGSVAKSLLQLYTENSDALDIEVSAQIRINPFDLLGNEGVTKVSEPLIPQTPDSFKIGPVEQKIMDLIDASQDSVNQRELLQRIADKNKG